MTPLALASTSPADPVGFAELLIGLPVATVVVAVVLLLGVALHRRILVLGRELTQVETARDGALTALEESHLREVAALRHTIEGIKGDRDWWRDTAVRALDLGERAVASRGDRP